MNWNDPAARAELIERVGPDAYNESQAAHHAASVVSVVNGYKIMPIGSRFGHLFTVVGTSTAYDTQAQAEDFARRQKPGGAGLA